MSKAHTTTAMIEIAKDLYGRDFEFLRQGKIKGRNTFLTMGFQICENPEYMKKDNRYFHYNKIKKCWLGQTPIFTNENVLEA